MKPWFAKVTDAILDRIGRSDAAPPSTFQGSASDASRPTQPPVRRERDQGFAPTRQRTERDLENLPTIGHLRTSARRSGEVQR